ncbi:MAG: putative rane protein [Actinomycetospora sp.]|nr:putative rane protein [Actinomycetospora sp.]
MSATDDNPGGSSALDATPSAYQEVQRSPEFVSLRRRWRGFIFTMSAIFLGWFLVYVLLSDFAYGVVNTIATIYVRFANKNLDDDAEALKQRVEGNL